MPFISICVPAYKRTSYLQRLLTSVAAQTFRDFEVVITDDSPGNEVATLCQTFKKKLPIRYYKNAVALGTPENWNEAIRRAGGEWIKIMHDDDWFATPDSLQAFARAAAAHPGGFLFSAYHFVYEKENRQQEVRISRKDLKRLKENPFYLYRTNYIGNPSCTLYRKKDNLSFDSRFKWVVDFEFYIRYLTRTHAEPVYIDEPLIQVGVNDTQVTTYTFRVADVEIPENHQMLAAQGFRYMKNIFVYDYFWRLYRNLGIRKVAQIAGHGYLQPLPAVLQSIIRFQKKIPSRWLRIGAVSKSLMLLHYLTHYRSVGQP